MARIRIQRLEKELFKLISNVINFKLRDKRLSLVTITAIKLTNDLSYATIYFTHLDNRSDVSVLNALQKSSGFIKNEIAQAKLMRSIPELRFEYDRLEQNARNLDDIFAQIHAEKKEKEEDE